MGVQLSLPQERNQKVGFRKSFYLSDNALDLNDAKIYEKFMDFTAKQKSKTANGLNIHLEKLRANPNAFFSLVGGRDSHVGTLLNTGKMGVGSTDGVRLDRQGANAEMVNLQLQLNGVKGKTTIATLLFSKRFDIKFLREDIEANIKQALADDFLYEFEKICVLHLHALGKSCSSAKFKMILQKLSSGRELSLYDQVHYDL